MALNRSGQVELSKRIRIVAEWILSDCLTSDIITQGQQKWNVSERQMKRYIKEAHESFVQITEEKGLKARMNWHIHRRLKAIRDMDAALKKTPAGVSVINNTLDSIAKIEGVFVEKVDHTSKGKEVKKIIVTNKK